MQELCKEEEPKKELQEEPQEEPQGRRKPKRTAGEKGCDFEQTAYGMGRRPQGQARPAVEAFMVKG